MPLSIYRIDMLLFCYSVGKGCRLRLMVLTHLCFRGPPEIAVWIFDIFDNKFETENSFTKYLKKSCR